MLKLRAHHLLCIQAYIGRGYSEEFIKNMDSIVDTLNKDINQQILLVSDLDYICSRCPSNLDSIKCVSNKKVRSMDEKVLGYLEIATKEYTYHFLLERLKEKLNKEVFYDICGECEWYSTNICSNLLTEKGYLSK